MRFNYHFQTSTGYCQKNMPDFIFGLFKFLEVGTSYAYLLLPTDGEYPVWRTQVRRGD